MHFDGLYRVIILQCTVQKKQLVHSLNCTCRNYSGRILRLTVIAIYEYIEWSETAFIDLGEFDICC